MDSINIITTIKKISFLFFLILGLTHFTAGFFSAKNYLMPESAVVMKIFFIPFVLSSIAYVYGVIKEHMLFNDKYGRGIDYAFAAVGALALAGLLIIQFI